MEMHERLLVHCSCSDLSSECRSSQGKQGRPEISHRLSQRLPFVLAMINVFCIAKPRA
jgi:hypothetical protein